MFHCLEQPQERAEEILDGGGGSKTQQGSHQAGDCDPEFPNREQGGVAGKLPWKVPRAGDGGWEGLELHPSSWIWGQLCENRIGDFPAVSWPGASQADLGKAGELLVCSVIHIFHGKHVNVEKPSLKNHSFIGKI